MCFSPEASFVAAGVLAAGSVAIARIPKDRAAVPLSLVPAVFAVHQFVEGTIWLSSEGVLPDAQRTGAVLVYVAIAFVLWPILVPLSAYLLETGRARRTIMLGCEAIGLGVALTLVVAIARSSVQVSVCSCRLAYTVNAPGGLIVPYALATCLPFLASGRRGLVLFGAGITASCAAAGLAFYDATFPSVWCFFAAVLSGGLYLYFREEARLSASPRHVSMRAVGSS